MALPNKHRSTVRLRPPRMEDASFGLAHDLATLDREVPGWDYEVRIEGAMRRLRIDASEANKRDVELLFGKDMATDAWRRVNAEAVVKTADAERPRFTNAVGPVPASLDLGNWPWLEVGQKVTAVLRVSTHRHQQHVSQTFIHYTGFVSELNQVGSKTTLTLSDVSMRYVRGAIPTPASQPDARLTSKQLTLQSRHLVSILSEDDLSRRRRASFALARAQARAQLQPRKLANASFLRRKIPLD